MANAVGTNGQDDGGGSGGVGARPPRLPRWTRQEILVLIQGKKVAESKGRGRSRVQQMGSSMAPLVGVGRPVEPKWATVSSYCRRHGVNRGPVQCRKRWSNLAGDFKKIKEWELGRVGEGGHSGGGRGGGETFWSMRNDVRRERRLPGFFDREVYDILDGTVAIVADDDDVAIRKETSSVQLLPPPPPPPAPPPPVHDDEEETVFDSGRAAPDDGLFSDFEADDEADDDERPLPLPPPPEPVAATPISERKSVSSHLPSSSDQAAEAVAGKQQAATPSEAKKKKRRKMEEQEESGRESTREPTLEQRLLDVLERNGRMLGMQLEAQNINNQLDRDQRREQTHSVVQVLGKLADALERIADKL